MPPGAALKKIETNATPSQGWRRIFNMVSTNTTGEKLPAYLHHFSADYQEARQIFVSACNKVDAVLSSSLHPKAGPNGEALYTDIAVLGPEEASSALVLQSGTHGVEGFAGSAIQTALLHDPLLPQLVSSVPRRKSCNVQRTGKHSDSRRIREALAG